MQQVHWAVATWTDPAEDPPALAGLGKAVLAAAQNGTWNTGSRDPARERQALADLDACWQQLPAQPDATQRQRLQDCTAAAAALADPSMLPRLLAALPVHRCELEQRGPIAVLVLTTLAADLPEVAAMLLDRRERQALREQPACWQRRTLTTVSSLEAELLALSMPDHPLTRNAIARPMPSRDEAMAAWARTQRPERTLHVLLGDFDINQATTVLQQTFVRTDLPNVPVAAPNPPRPFAGLRRSQVPGAKAPTVLIGWPLPANVDPHVLAAAKLWLAQGADSRLGLELQRAGRAKATITSRAPWPTAIGGNGLFVLEIADPNGIDGLADLVLRSVRTTLANAPTESAMQATTAVLQQEWRAATADARQLAAATAATLLAWPRPQATAASPQPVDGKVVLLLLQQTCFGQPAIVEGRP